MKFEKDYFEIRLESIGGLGANLTGKLLGEIGALYLNLNASSFASYGSEKRGSPVKSYIRYSELQKEIRVNSPIENPDILAVFHERLAGKPQVMAGVNEKTSVIINSDKSCEFIRNRFKMYGGTLYIIDALKIAMENKTRINMVMLGAIAKASGFITLESVIEAVKNTIGKKYPASLESNIKGIKAGFENVSGVYIEPDGKYPYEKYKETERKWGYKNAPIGGVNPLFGNSVTNNLSASREGHVPIFTKKLCINCGFCDTACPDMVFQFTTKDGKAVNLGPDYNYCKGCLRCVEVCPTKALTEGLERETDISETQVDNIDLLTKNFSFDDVGDNSLVESVSFTTNSLD